MVTNNEFLKALFGDDAPWVHVTDFEHDPSNIPKDRHLAAWMGDYFSRYQMRQGTNQYFTISNFYVDDKGKARRRKALYRHTPVIVLDDVKEKLSMEEVSKLPAPSWILETSPGSEQWGYILDKPCTERSRVENLLDGLVANGLAPGGKDPGMKGVTRYVRLPEGYNNKASKLVNGLPFKCQMTTWSPFSTVTLEQLAAPFAVNLDAQRRESRVDGAAEVSDHPLLQTATIHVKEIRSDGRFDIRCPWVDEHTGGADDGAAVFTNDDGSIGFKCHHGACQTRTGRDLLRSIEVVEPGFTERFSSWKMFREMDKVVGIQTPNTVTFMSQPLSHDTTSVEPVSFMEPSTEVALPSTDDAVQAMVDKLKRENHTSKGARDVASAILKVIDDLPQMDRVNWHEQVCDAMRWSKPVFKDIMKDLRQQWYVATKKDIEFQSSMLYVKELNQFYDWQSRIFFTPDAYQNSFSHEDTDAKKNALQENEVTKVDKLDYAPKRPRLFQERGRTYGNTWYDGDESQGVEGDASCWLQHWDAMGWSEHRDHMLQWMAWTILHPDRKINHMMLMGSGEGCGKDFLLYPLVKAMGENSKTIAGEELLEGFNDYVLSTKHLHINEAELGDRREAVSLSNKLKPLAAAPPDSIRVNQKGIKPIEVRNVLSVSMTTNSQLPIRLNGPSRRVFAVWSDLNPRDAGDDMTPEWKAYWDHRWSWIKAGGADACIWYLRNCVDLTNFNPSAPPPVTEFLRDIRDASKSPMLQTVEAFIAARVGAFKSDLITCSEASNTLRAGDFMHGEIMFTDSKLFSPIRVGSVLKEMPSCLHRRAARGKANAKIWIVRDAERYAAMGVSELYTEYERQIQLAKESEPMTIIQENER